MLRRYRSTCATANDNGTATTDDSKSWAAIRSGGSGGVSINGGTVTATAYDRGISAKGDIQISGGTVLVKGTHTSGEGWGIGNSNGRFEVTGGDVTAEWNWSK